MTGYCVWKLFTQLGAESRADLCPCHLPFVRARMCYTLIFLLSFVSSIRADTPANCSYQVRWTRFVYTPIIGLSTARTLLENGLSTSQREVVTVKSTAVLAPPLLRRSRWSWSSPTWPSISGTTRGLGPWSTTRSARNPAFNFSFWCKGFEVTVAGRSYFAFSDFSQEGQVVQEQFHKPWIHKVRHFLVFRWSRASVIAPDQDKDGAMMSPWGTGLASQDEK